MNMGLFYGSSTCYTEMAAEKIRDIIGPELVTLHNLKDDSPKLMEQYDVLILGIPTWDFGEIQEDWEAVWDHGQYPRSDRPAWHVWRAAAFPGLVCVSVPAPGLPASR